MDTQATDPGPAPGKARTKEGMATLTMPASRAAMKAPMHTVDTTNHG